MGERYKDFPPGWGHLRIPTSSRKAALAALALYAPCRPRAFLFQRAAWVITKLVGPRTLPGRAVHWTPNVPPGIWSEITARLHGVVGSFNSVAGYERLQSSRKGFALLLLREGAPVAFVKLRAGESAATENERQALELAWRQRPRSFRVPRPLASGSLDEWHFLAMEPLAPRLHRPARAPRLDLITSEVQSALFALRRPLGVAAHWRPMHGDFAPWNLRRTAGGDLVLVDWEDAAWGPPGADEVFFEATQAALGIRQTHVSPHEEAIDYWLAKLAERHDTARDRRLSIATTGALHRMRPRSGYGDAVAGG